MTNVAYTNTQKSSQVYKIKRTDNPYIIVWTKRPDGTKSWDGYTLPLEQTVYETYTHAKKDAEWLRNHYNKTAINVDGSIGSQDGEGCEYVIMGRQTLKNLSQFIRSVEPITEEALALKQKKLSKNEPQL
jgi:hypothetical protein